MTTAQAHPFDRALALEPLPGEPGRYGGQASPDYWNMVGPFGGMTAATAMQAVMNHPGRQGLPVALTVNFVAPVAPGDYVITARPVRTNRSTQHWMIEMAQPETQDGGGAVFSGTAVTALRRDTWGDAETAMPAVPSPATLDRFAIPPGLPPWFDRYALVPVEGHVPSRWDGSVRESLTRLWVRDDPPRPLDFAALAAKADIFYPRIWLRRATLTPVGTVSMTVYFHADEAMLARAGDGYLLGQGRGQAYFKGFHDQSAQLWSEQGELLATTHQVVYYKS